MICPTETTKSCHESLMMLLQILVSRLYHLFEFDCISLDIVRFQIYAQATSFYMTTEEDVCWVLPSHGGKL